MGLSSHGPRVRSRARCFSDGLNSVWHGVHREFALFHGEAGEFACEGDLLVLWRERTIAWEHDEFHVGSFECLNGVVSEIADWHAMDSRMLRGWI